MPSPRLLRCGASGSRHSLPRTAGAQPGKSGQPAVQYPSSVASAGQSSGARFIPPCRRRMNRDGDLIDPASLPEPRASRFAAGNRLRGVRRLWPSSSDRRPGMACRDSRPRGCASEHCRIRTGRLTACAGLAKKVSLEAAGKRPEYSEAGSPDPRDGTVPAQPPESHASSLQPPDSISSHAWRTTGRPGAPDPPERFTGHPQT